MYTCNNGRHTVCCEQGTLRANTGPMEHVPTASELQWTNERRRGGEQVSEGDNQVDKRYIHVALATQ